ncbi:MAG: hypothetical protein Q8P30_02720 [Candidatus Uhrbacteria bacterium]|nr:hypothetical protein [Candidatus Uhrbacteria bacterium]
MFGGIKNALFGEPKRSPEELKAAIAEHKRKQGGEVEPKQESEPNLPDSANEEVVELDKVDTEKAYTEALDVLSGADPENIDLNGDPKTIAKQLLGRIVLEESFSIEALAKQAKDRGVSVQEAINGHVENIAATIAERQKLGIGDEEKYLDFISQNIAERLSPTKKKKVA